MLSTSSPSRSRSARFLAAGADLASRLASRPEDRRLAHQGSGRFLSSLFAVDVRPLSAILFGLALSLGVVPLLEYWPGSMAARDQVAPLCFLVPVVLSSNFGGWWPGVCVSFSAVGIWNWFFLLPAQSLGIDSTADLVTLAVYLAVATLVGQLSTAMRRRARAALQHEAELAAVLDVTNAVASTLDMATVLGLVLEQVQRVIECTSAAVLLQEGDQICIAAYRGPTPREQVVGQTWPLSGVTVYRELVGRPSPMILADLWEASPEAEMFRRAGKIRVLGQQHERSWLWVPLTSNEQVIGVLSLSDRAPHAFTERQAQFSLAIGHQVAVAIQNARLYTRSRETAAEEERNRLARELHDSVTQMLFSSSLVAEVLSRLWDRDQDAARQSLEDLRLLARGASAEMRTLLVELRPAALKEARLEELLHQVAEATTTRTQIPIAVSVDGDHPLPSDVQIAFYRIAQQALSNAVKHAEPRSVAMTLRARPEGIELEVHDDGRGFDLTGVTPGRLGLSTMRERADGIGGTLTVDSAAGSGTRVVVWWPRQAE